MPQKPKEKITKIIVRAESVITKREPAKRFELQKVRCWVNGKQVPNPNVITIIENPLSILRMKKRAIINMIDPFSPKK